MPSSLPRRSPKIFPSLFFNPVKQRQRNDSILKYYYLVQDNVIFSFQKIQQFAQFISPEINLTLFLKKKKIFADPRT